MTFRTITKTVHIDGGAEIGVSLSMQRSEMDVRILRDDTEIGHITFKQGHQDFVLDHALDAGLDELEMTAVENALGLALAGLFKD